jgi:hypothetical protein
MHMALLDEKIEKLPLFLKKEVLDFAEFISRKYQSTRRAKLKFSWSGKLAEFSSNYDSLKLQKKSLE